MQTALPEQRSGHAPEHPFAQAIVPVATRDDEVGAHLRGGFRQDMVALSPFGRAVPPEVRARILKIKQGFADDSVALYRGPLKDNEGNVVLREGQVIANDDNAFKLDVKFLVEGAIGKTGLKK